jgi:hypothetical protein
MTKAYSGHARDDEARLLRDTIETLREENAGLAARVKQLEEEREELGSQEPAAWYLDDDEGREYNGTPEMSDDRSGVPLYTRPIPATPNRFCPRCGKDLKDMVAHTCTPPRDERQPSEAGGGK